MIPVLDRCGYAVRDGDYRSLCLRFFDWLQQFRDAGGNWSVDVGVDWGFPVEARFWADCLRFAGERTPGDEFKGPLIHEIATAQLIAGRLLGWLVYEVIRDEWPGPMRLRPSPKAAL